MIPAVPFSPDPTIMFVDPGFSGTGIAIWDRFDFSEAKRTGVAIPPLFHKSFSRKDLGAYVDLMVELINRNGVEEIWCENAAYHGTASVKGQMVAAKGDLVRLAQIIGAYEAVAYLEKVQFNLVPVTTWKGQLPKDVVNRRIRGVWPECDCTNHDWDAVGIGFWRMGVINQLPSTP